MTFKDKLKRYKEGRATKEEKIYIEKELEKYESMEEYYSEEISNQFFNEGLEDESLDFQENETKDIQKVVNRRLGKVVLTSVLIGVLLYIGIFYGASNLVNQFYYDPTTISQQQENNARIADFNFNMQAYTSLNMPGYSIASHTSQVSNGFGQYEVGYSLRNLFENKEKFHFVNLSRGRLTLAYDGIFGPQRQFGLSDGFEKIHSPYPDEASDQAIASRDEEINRKNEKTFEYLEKLNDLSYISMSLTFNKDLSMEEFHLLQEKYSKLDFKWVGVRTTEPGTRWSDEQPMHLIGFNPNFNDEPSSNYRPNPELYPYFNLIDIMEESPIPVDEFPEIYGTHFKSRLSYLRDQEEFVEIFDFNPTKIDFYNHSLDYIESNGVKTYGILVYGTANEFLKTIDELPYETLYINEILPSAPNIYNY